MLRDMAIDDKRALADRLCGGCVYEIDFVLNSRGYITIVKIKRAQRDTPIIDATVPSATATLAK